MHTRLDGVQQDVITVILPGFLREDGIDDRRDDRQIAEIGDTPRGAERQTVCPRAPARLKRSGETLVSSSIPEGGPQLQPSAWDAESSTESQGKTLDPVYPCHVAERSRSEPLGRQTS